MLQEELKDYNARIIQATKGELIVITYELIMDLIEDAIGAKEHNELSAFDATLRKAQKALRTLIDGLDFNYEISFNLMALYLFVNEQMSQAILKRELKSLVTAKQVLTILLNGWKEAAMLENDNPLIENAQKLYAGLTYGKGTLNETIMDNHQTRGFKA
jgi:flagellar protein FliS